MSRRFFYFPITAAQANVAIETHHRHAGPVIGAKFCLAAIDRNPGMPCGVVAVGRPVSRILDDGVTLEINRLVTNGASDAPSALLGAAARKAWDLGALRLVTYTLESESGVSLRAAGWARDAWKRKLALAVDANGKRQWVWEEKPFPARDWNRPGRPHQSGVAQAARWRWWKLNPMFFDRRIRKRRWSSDWTPAEVLGNKAALSGQRRDSNPFLRDWGYAPALRRNGGFHILLAEQWREGYELGGDVDMDVA